MPICLGQDPHASGLLWREPFCRIQLLEEIDVSENPNFIFEVEVLMNKDMTRIIPNTSNANSIILNTATTSAQALLCVLRTDFDRNPRFSQRNSRKCIFRLRLPGINKDLTEH